MTTLMKLPQGFNPAYAPQAITGGNPTPRPPMTGGVTPTPFGAPNGGTGQAFDPSLIQAVPMMGAEQAAMLNQPGMMQNKMATPQMMQMAQSQAGTAAQTTGGNATGGSWYSLGENNPVPTGGTDEQGGWSGFGDFFGNLGEWLSGNSDAITGIGSITGALMNANDTRQLGVGIQSYLDSLGQQLMGDSQFQGYGVTTGLGNSSAGYDPATGKFGTDLGMSDLYKDYNWGDAGKPVGYVAGMNGLAQQAANSAYGAANDIAAQAGISVADRQNSIYNDIMATQNPELNRMQAEQQAAEYARGRGGIRGSQYGGTAEDAAMARARAMASNDAAFRAREMANNERGMLGQLAGQMGAFGNQAAQAAYLPMQQQMAMMGLGQKDADMAQTGQLTGLDYMTQLALGGTNANMQAQHSANQLTGNIYDTLLSNIGGAQGSDGGSSSGLLGAFGSGFEWLGSLFGD